MDGRALSQRYFQQAALPLLRTYMPQIVERCAAGLCAGGLDIGCGSEVHGYDDFISRDHNWGPRFFLFLSEEDYGVYAEDLRNLFAQKLSPSFEGMSIRPTSPQATHFHITSPLRNVCLALGVDLLPTTETQWLQIPESKLFEYASGWIYYDPIDMVGSVKRRFATYPRNVLLKRLAGAVFMLHTAGNALRCAMRCEWVACRSYVDIAIASAQRIAFYVANRYPPHVKWRGRAFRELPNLPEGWAKVIDRLAMNIDLRSIHQDIQSLLSPLGDMLCHAGFVKDTPWAIEGDFLPFDCYGYAKAIEAQIQGELSGREMAIPLDQMIEGYLPLPTETVATQWQVGRPGIAKNIILS